MTWSYANLDEYLLLVRRFPLTPITSREHHKVAMDMLQQLAIAEQMSKAESDYFDVLSGLILNYEKATVTRTNVSPPQALKFLLEQHGLNQSDIGRMTGLQRSHVSEFFAERRDLPKQAAAKLATIFKVDPTLFLPPLQPVESIGAIVNISLHQITPSKPRNKSNGRSFKVAAGSSKRSAPLASSAVRGAKASPKKRATKRNVSAAKIKSSTRRKRELV